MKSFYNVEKATLFIGGMADGDRLLIPDTATIWRVSKPGKQIDEKSREVISHTYHHMAVGAGGEVDRVMIWDQLTQGQAMMKFIDCYNPRTNQEMSDADWHQVQTVTGTDIMTMVIDIMQGRSTQRALAEGIADHCKAAYDVGRNKYGKRIDLEKLDEAQPSNYLVIRIDPGIIMDYNAVVDRALTQDEALKTVAEQRDNGSIGDYVLMAQELEYTEIKEK